MTSLQILRIHKNGSSMVNSSVTSFLWKFVQGVRDLRVQQGNLVSTALPLTTRRNVRVALTSASSNLKMMLRWRSFAIFWSPKRTTLLQFGLHRLVGRQVKQGNVDCQSCKGWALKSQSLCVPWKSPTKLTGLVKPTSSRSRRPTCFILRWKELQRRHATTIFSQALKIPAIATTGTQHQCRTLLNVLVTKGSPSTTAVTGDLVIN